MSRQILDHPGIGHPGMGRSVVSQLILKDLYLCRWLMAGSVIGGALCLALMPFGRVPTYVGAISLLCVLIVLLIFVVMNNVVQERKEKTQLFVLSLPISVAQYSVAKAASSAIAFGAPWLLLTLATMVTVARTNVPDALLPIWMAVLAYLFLYFCVLLAVALFTASNAWHATVITIGNLSPNFFIPILMGRLSIDAARQGVFAVWTADLAALVGLQILAGLLALGLAVHFHARRPDYH